MHVVMAVRHDEDVAISLCAELSDSEGKTIVCPRRISRQARYGPLALGPIEPIVGSGGSLLTPRKRKTKEPV